MPLQDVEWGTGGRPGQGEFLARWAAAIADALNAQDGPGFTAAVVREARTAVRGRLPAISSAPFVAPARFTNRLDVAVTAGGRVVAAVLFACPDNKAESDAALGFAVRAAALLADGAAVVIVDAVAGPPAWAAHLHSLAPVYPAARRPRGADRPVLIVQPVAPGGTEGYAVWHHAVAPGSPLPTVAVTLPGDKPLTIDLEATHAAAWGQVGGT